MLIRELNDPRLKQIFVTDVKIDKELAFADVYVSALEGASRSKDVLAGLAALRETARERSERDARYRERDRRDDWSVSAGVRIAFFAAIAVLGVVLWLSNNHWHVHYRGGIPPRKLATSVGVALALITAVTPPDCA